MQQEILNRLHTGVFLKLLDISVGGISCELDNLTGLKKGQEYEVVKFNRSTFTVKNGVIFSLDPLATYNVECIGSDSFYQVPVSSTVKYRWEILDKKTYSGGFSYAFMSHPKD